jgi:endonuclease YncB( thermonuclease family)
MFTWTYVQAVTRSLLVSRKLLILVVVSIALRSVSVVVVFLSNLRIARERRLISGAFFVCLLFSSLRVYAVCVPSAYEDLKVLSEIKVLDGDTIRAVSVGSLRFVGVNTPEMNYGKSGRSPEPFAEEATNYLKTLVVSHDVFYESYGRDKYGRLLGGLWISKPDDSLMRSVSELLLQAGYAFQVFESSSFYEKCLAQSERMARQRRLGVWSQLSFWLNKNKGGFVIWSGKAERISQSKKFKWVSMSSKRVVRVPLKWFSEGKISDSELMSGFEARGWAVHRKKTRYEPYMLPLKMGLSLRKN